MSGGTRSYQMARRLVERGHEVHMITSDRDAAPSAPHWRTTTEAGIQVHWTPVKYSNKMAYSERLRSFFSFAWRASRKAAEIGGDIVFATSTPLTIAIPAVYAARRSRVPLVFEVRDLWPAVPIAIGAIRNPILKWAARRLERFAYRNSARVVALAPGMRDEIVATGYPREKTTVIPNGCDIAEFTDSGEEAELRSSYEWLGNRPLLVFTGTFGVVTGMDYLVRLAAAIDRIDPDIRVAAVGTGRSFDSTRELATELGVLDKNFFLIGQLPKHKAAVWTRTADMSITMLTGPDVIWRDATQNKFFDSLAAGKPVANNFRGWQGILAEEAGAGIILSSTDIDSASRDIVAALRDTEWLASAAEAGRKLALERFNRDDLAANLGVLLEEVHDEAQSARARS